MASNRRYLIQLIEDDHIPAQKTDTALQLTGVTPDGSAWLKFIDQLLIWLGTLAMALSAMYFVAYNWQDIDRITKFALSEVLLVAAVLAYWRLGPDTLPGKALLMTAAILVGVLLALFGQTYQTGADPWQLFFFWSILLLPWAVIGRLEALWIVILLLFNIASILYYHTFQGAFRLLFAGDLTLYWWAFILNTVALLIWEFAAARLVWLKSRWAARLIAMWSILPLTWLMILVIVNDQSSSGLLRLAWICWPLWLAASYLYYRHNRVDVFMLALGCFSCLIITDVLVAQYLLDYRSAADFLAIAAITTGIGAGSALWLRNIHKELHSEI